jgi:hypothetical protein
MTLLHENETFSCKLSKNVTEYIVVKHCFRMSVGGAQPATRMGLWCSNSAPIVCMCECTCMCVCMYVCMYVCIMYVLRMYLFCIMYVWMYMYVCVCVCMYVCMYYVCIAYVFVLYHVCMYVCVCVCLCVCVMFPTSSCGTLQWSNKLWKIFSEDHYKRTLSLDESEPQNKRWLQQVAGQCRPLQRSTFPTKLLSQDNCYKEYENSGSAHIWTAMLDIKRITQICTLPSCCQKV